MMELLELTPDDLGGDLASRVHELLNDAWPEDTPNEGHYYRTRGAPTTILILRRAPHVLAHVRLYERQVAIGTEKLIIGMLGGFVVSLEQRRKGYCRKSCSLCSRANQGSSYSVLDLVRQQPACV